MEAVGVPAFRPMVVRTPTARPMPIAPTNTPIAAMAVLFDIY
jgi:hypothetical protein